MSLEGQFLVASRELVDPNLARWVVLMIRHSDEGVYTKIVNRVERKLIEQVMAACDNVQTKAAGRLGINRNTLHKKLKEYGLEGGDAAETPG